MITRRPFRWFLLTLSVPLLAICFVSQNAGTQSKSDDNSTATTKTANGLTVVTFVTNPGKVTVNLPDDMRAGDTISGTVVTEPQGQTNEEKAQNQSVLNGYVIDLGDGTKVSADKPRFTWTPQIPQPPTTSPRYRLKIVEVLPGQNLSEKTTASTVIVFYPTHPSGAIITHGDSPATPTFTVPPLGQTGRSTSIFGPFDGDSSNTTLTIGGESLQILAESPRQAVFTSPPNVVGAAEIHVKDQNVETTSPFRNLKVDLSAPKTSLLKGESTELHIQVNGLEGLKEPVPLTLEANGVITMEGGMFQPLVIQPSQVGADGRYSTTRGITGVQAGGWSATATVETHPFNVCLQDDNNAQTVILINSFTGDYVFSCPGCYSTGQTDGATAPAKGAVTMKGCTITLEHNTTDRRVTAKIDECTKTGSASVQTSSPKMKFTITDRNTANNTCVCGPGCK